MEPTVDVMVVEDDATVLAVVTDYLRGAATGSPASATAAPHASCRSEVEELDTSRRQFFAWISHDLRTPLTGVSALAEHVPQRFRVNVALPRELRGRQARRRRRQPARPGRRPPPAGRQSHVRSRWTPRSRERSRSTA